MSTNGTAHGLPARIPSELRALRAKAMLEECCETLGVRETRCPACRGTGWGDREALRACGLCAGFQVVPESLAQWYLDERTRGSAGGVVANRGDLEVEVPEPVRQARARREVHSTRPERLGRAASPGTRVHMPQR
jgi:hypothetical protein